MSRASAKSSFDSDNASDNAFVSVTFDSFTGSTIYMDLTHIC